MRSPAHIVLVEDDKHIATLVEDYLVEDGFRVSAVSCGADMWPIIRRGGVSLVLLDLILPGTGGLTLAKELRAQSDIGIIIMTGRSELVDRIIGLEIGADDFVAKPFHLRELLARVKSVLRRVPVSPVRHNHPGTLRFNGWQLDIAARGLRTPDGDNVHLTTAEFELLRVFAVNANRVLSRDELLDGPRTREAGAFDRAIDVQVGRLRRKIGDDPLRPNLIKTVHGLGYVFTGVVETD